MSRRARMFLGVALAAAFVGGAPQAASAAIAPPVIVPAPDSDGYNVTSTPACFPRPGYTQADALDQSKVWRNCLLPKTNAVMDWPNVITLGGPADPFFWPAPAPDAELQSNGFRTSRSFILSEPGYVIWLGVTNSTEGYPLIWYDIGSGTPIAPASGPWQFNLAGKFAWECLVCSGTIRQKLQGLMYVIGPRAIMTAKLAAADNSGTNIAYEFDASGSFVTDYTAHSIVKYEFDFQDDGVFDVTSPEPTAQATLTSGLHVVRVRVTDNHDVVSGNEEPARTAVWPMYLEVPFVRSGNPEPNPIADNGANGNLRTGVKFDAAKIKVKAAKRIRRIVLSKRGLSVKVSGLTKGDRIRARLLKGKRSLVASGKGTSTSSTTTVRLRTGRSGRRILKAKPRPKRLVLDVAIEGGDGFQLTKRLAVRVS